jgi:hypothetical protein
MKISRMFKSFGQKVGSTESYSSFDFNVNIEATVDIDTSTEEGKKEFTETSDKLAKLCRSVYKRDLVQAAKEFPELAITINKKTENGLMKDSKEE